MAAKLHGIHIIDCLCEVRVPAASLIGLGGLKDEMKAIDKRVRARDVFTKFGDRPFALVLPTKCRVCELLAQVHSQSLPTCVGCCRPSWQAAIRGSSLCAHVDQNLNADAAKIAASSKRKGFVVPRWRDNCHPQRLEVSQGSSLARDRRAWFGSRGGPVSTIGLLIGAGRAELPRRPRSGSAFSIGA